MKRFMYVVLSALLVLSIVSLGFTAESKKGKKGAKETGKKAKYTIAFIQAGPDPYYEMGYNATKRAAELLGDVNLVRLYSDAKADKEIANVEDAITQKVDAIMLFSVSTTSMKAAVDKAKKAGIPLSLFYGYSPDTINDVVFNIQADTDYSAKVVGEWVVKNIPEGEIAVIMGQLGRGDAEAEKGSFEKTIEQNIKLEIVAVAPADWNRQKAFQVMTDMITAHPKMVCAFVANEDMALGAIKALEEANKLRQVKVVSQNGAPYGLEAIKDGRIAATSAWSCAQEGVIAMKGMYEHLKGKQVPKLIVTPNYLVTKANLDDAFPWVLTDEQIKKILNTDLSAYKTAFEPK